MPTSVRGPVPRAYDCCERLCRGRRATGGASALVGGGAGIWQEPPRAGVRPRGGGGGRLVLYGACDAVVRTPYRPFAEALERLVRTSDPADAARRPRRRPEGSSCGSCPTSAPRRRAAGADRRPIRRRSGIAFTPRSPTCWWPSAVGGRCSSCSRTATGPTHRAPAPLVIWRVRPRTSRMLLSRRSGTRRRTCRRQLSDALVDLRRSEGCRPPSSHRPLRRGDRGVRPASLAAAETAGLPGLAAAIAKLTSGNAFLDNRAVAHARRLRSARRRGRPRTGSRSPSTSSEARRAFARSSSQRLSRLAPQTTELLEVAAIVGPEFDLSVLERASSRRRRRGCSPGSTRPCGTG